MNIDQKLHEVFASIFGDAAENITDDDGPGSVDGWDSLNHMNLILSIEAEFDVQFTTAEIPELLSVGQIRTRVRVLTEG